MKLFKKLDLTDVRIYKNEIQDIVDAADLVGQEVYTSDDEDFEFYQKFELVGVRKVKGSPFNYVCRTSDNLDFSHKYFILAKDVKFVEEKEKNLRPFKNIDEFCNETGCEVVGEDLITIRNKNTKKDYVLFFVGYSDDEVHLGGYVLTFADLLKNYEYALNSFEWLPLGIEE